jgi:hypothetical protein
MASKVGKVGKKCVTVSNNKHANSTVLHGTPRWRTGLGASRSRWFSAFRVPDADCVVHARSLKWAIPGDTVVAFAPTLNAHAHRTPRACVVCSYSDMSASRSGGKESRDVGGEPHA